MNRKPFSAHTHVLSVSSIKNHKHKKRLFTGQCVFTTLEQVNTVMLCLKFDHEDPIFVKYPHGGQFWPATKKMSRFWTPRGWVSVDFAPQGQNFKVFDPAGPDFSGCCPRVAGFFVHGRAWPETYNQQKHSWFYPNPIHSGGGGSVRPR